MAERRIPRPDGNFDAYVQHYYEAVKQWWKAQGLDAHDLDALVNALAAWSVAYPANVAAQAAADSAALAKEAAREGLEAAIRPITAFVQNYAKTSDADRATIGITVRDPRGTPTRPPTSRPIVRIESGQRLQHRLRFIDESSPTRRAKPRGTAGAEVWLALVAINDAPPPPPPTAGTGPSAYRYIELSSRGETLSAFKAADAGRQACYALRWVTPTGERGPWSEVCTATVAA